MLHISHASKYNWKVLKVMLRVFFFNLVTYNFKSMIPGISLRLFYGDLIYNLWRIKGALKFILLGSKWLTASYIDILTKWPSACARPFYSPVQTCLKHCHLTNKAEGTTRYTLSGPPCMRQTVVLAPLIAIRDFFSLWT